MNIIHSLKGLYAILSPQGQVFTWSVNGHEEITKSLWLRSTQLRTWEEAEALGYTCKRINVLYELAE